MHYFTMAFSTPMVIGFSAFGPALEFAFAFFILFYEQEYIYIHYFATLLGRVDISRFFSIYLVFQKYLLAKIFGSKFDFLRTQTRALQTQKDTYDEIQIHHPIDLWFAFMLAQSSLADGRRYAEGPAPRVCRGVRGRRRS